MNRKQKSKQKQRAASPVFVFTPASLTLTQEAMKLFEQSLQRSKSQTEKMAFAEQTMRSVNQKLAFMRQSIGELCLTPFDYNEKMVIAVAIKQYEMTFLLGPLTAKKRQELQICRQLEQFTSTGVDFQITSPRHD